MQPPRTAKTSTSLGPKDEPVKRTRSRWLHIFFRALSPFMRLPVIGGLGRTTWLILTAAAIVAFVAGSFWARTTPMEQTPPARFSPAWWVTSLELHRELQLASFGDDEIESVAVVRTPAGQDRLVVGGRNALLAFSDDQGRTWTRLNYDGRMGGFAVPSQRAPFPDALGIQAAPAGASSQTNSQNTDAASAKSAAAGKRGPSRTVVPPRGQQNPNPTQLYRPQQQTAPPPATKPGAKPVAALPFSRSVLPVVYAAEIPSAAQSSGASSSAGTLAASQANAQASPLLPQPLPQDILAVCRADGSLVLVMAGNRAAISGDSGETWKASFLSAFTGPPRPSISLTDFLAGRVSGVRTQPNRLSTSVSSIDGIIGDTYLSLFLVRSELASPRSVFLSADGRAWAVTDRALGTSATDKAETGFIYRSDHRDARWSEAFRTPGIALRDIAFSVNGTTGYVVGQKGGIWRWQESQSIWTPITRGSLNPGQASAEQANHLYWKLPPPWTYFILLFSVGWLMTAIFISAAPGADTLAEAADWLSSGDIPRELHANVALISVSDRPLGEEDVDRLGFRGIARGVAGFLRNPKTQLPITLAINGAWGTGKSSLMNLISGDLKRAGFRPVWFNAWHHQEDENLLASLLQSVRSEASPPLVRKGGLAFRLRLGWFRFGRYYPRALAMVAIFIGLWAAESWYDHASNLKRFVAEKFGTASQAQLGAKQPGSAAALQAAQGTARQTAATEAASAAASAAKPSSGWVDSVVKFLGDLHEGSDKVIPAVLPRPLAVLYLLFQIVPAALQKLKAFTANPASLLHSAAPGVSEKEIEAQTSFRMRFAKEFADVTRALGQNHRLVIFVDDLDRCRPINVAEMMEAINYVTVAGDCAFVLGLETEVVRAALGLSFSAMAQEIESRRILLPVPGAVVSGNATPVIPDETAECKRKNRDAFARRYVEKLINIEMNVPQLDVQKKQALFAVEPPAAPAADPFERARKVARVGRLLEPAAMFILVLALGWGAGRILVRLAEWQAKDYFQDQLEKANAAPQTTALASPPAPGGAEAPNAAPANPAPAESQTDSGKTPDVLPGENPLPAAMLRNPLSWIVLAGLFTIVIQLLAREPVPPAKDSNEFSRALAAWSWIAGDGLDTPRATKRFLNRLRFLAMRQHPPSVQLPGLMKLLLTAEQQKRALEQEQAQASAASAKEPIPEAILVALAALEVYPKGTEANRLSAPVLSQTLESLSQFASHLVAQGDLRSGPFLAELRRLAAAEPSTVPEFADEKSMHEFFASRAKDGSMPDAAKGWAASASNKITQYLDRYCDLGGDVEFT